MIENRYSTDAAAGCPQQSPRAANHPPRPLLTPKPYQVIASEFIIRHPRCALWADMGMGKTISTLLALRVLRIVDDVFPVLIIGPKRVAVDVWPAEIARWPEFSDMRVSVCVGTRDQRIAAANTPAEVYCVNYETIPWLVQFWGDRWPYRMCVSDEATRLKSFRCRQGGQRAQALSKVAHLCERFVELTGTPAPNGLQDLWGQLWFIDRGRRLGRTYTAFQRRWFRSVNFGGGHFGGAIEPMPHSQQEIEAAVADVCLSIRGRDWFSDLRRPIEITINAPMPPKAAAMYADMERTFYAELDEQEHIEAVNAASKSMKLLQLSNGAAYLDGDTDRWSAVHDAKLDALESIVEEANGAPLLVAFQFRSDAERIKARFKQAETIDGSDSLTRWNAGKVPILLAHPASAGHGLNLQHGGHRLVFFGHWWDAEQRLQIIERIGPMRQLQSGYSRPVFIYNIVSGRIDRTVLTKIKTKCSVQEALLDARRSCG